MPQKGLKQVADVQYNALTPLIHLVQLHNKLKKAYLHVGALRRMTVTCFHPFCGIPNCPVSCFETFVVTCVIWPLLKLPISCSINLGVL